MPSSTNGRPSSRPLGPDAGRLIAEARTAVSGGKRFRAAFCHWGHRAIRPSVDDDAALARACASLEVLHASALVHDDFMDASDTRRGRPATHRAFEAEHRAAGWRGDPEQYGAAAAILLGDLLLGWAEDMLRRSGFPAEEVAPGLAIFEQCRNEVIAGQFLDVSVQARGRADVDTAMTVLRYKSAKYSIERPIHIGAALAGATPGQLEQLGRFGLPLGEAFQLRDDLLGVFGDPEETGKPAGDDLVEGKRTVLVALALDGAPRAAAERLDAALGTPLTGSDVDELRGIIDDSGARAQVEAVIGQLSEHAVEALRAADIDAHARDVLVELAAAATQRSRWARSARRVRSARPPFVVAPAASPASQSRTAARSGSPGWRPRHDGALAPQQHGERHASVVVDPRAQHAEGDAEGLLVRAGERRPAVPQQDDSVATAPDVVEAVGEGVEVLPVVVREVQRLAHRREEGRLGVGAGPAVHPAEAPAGVLDGVAYVGDVERAVPQMDPRGLVPRQDRCESAHVPTS